ncbi:MAG: alanine racemase [Prevotellaceae bacterium]|jgi:alanine racemase|nr:alanine racemase [Prevotellaceae bacterium]
MQFKITQGINNCTVICCKEDININLASIKKIFKHLPKNKNHAIIFSDLNLVDDNEELINKKIRLIAIGQNDQIKRMVNIDFYNDTDELIKNIDSQDRVNSKFFNRENILIIENWKMKPVIEHLELKSRPTHFEINLDSLAYNINYFRSKLKPATKMLCMLKANSYGIGNYEVACLMQLTGVDYLGVAATDEGVILRKSGIKLPIIVLTPEINNLERMIRNNLEPEIHNFRSLQTFNETCKKLNKYSYPIHIKINSGMNRQGFSAEQIDELINALQKFKYVKVSSIFTHLATADSYALEQLRRFDTISAKLRRALPHGVMRHALNSVGIEMFTAYQFDMVRLGIGMYGISEFARNKTKITGKLTSVITQIEEVPAGETVGYGREGIIGKKTKTIGVIPVGYADGLNRRLGKSKTYFTVNGKTAPVIGNICMDLCMIDITGIDTEEGDRVEIFGNSPTAIDIAKILGTISYEVFTSVAERVKRIYTVSEELIK